MAIIHPATLTPDKQELSQEWLAKQTWAAGLTLSGRIGGYRFDDPRGKVGVEFLLFRAGDAVVHLPMAYREAPLEGAEDYLVRTIDHSVLGTRYVYDGCADPVVVHALLSAILTGGEQAALDVHHRSGEVERREPTVLAKGSGAWSADAVPPFDGVTLRREDAIAVIEAGGFQITVKRLVDDVPAPGEETLEVVWPHWRGVLAGVRRLD